ncbi:glycosyltransferase family 1 protein [Lentzea tibetensis]|uniref:Glycosyltransferase family 1 protein n=1 Tax=Lentzea tibetensis TaxID=2591470 RepID=A0A563ES94_9PSEU|nr:glycosyltransferase [Lentzea tibetensis]TWP50520.1 glycosyltransferase family 1 protein [Lentzea tibetensis]
MNVLFVTGPSPATMFWAPPLATALRNAGHTVVLATTEETTPIAQQMAIPFVPVCDRPLEALLSTDRNGVELPWPVTVEEQIEFHGAWMARLAAASYAKLRELADHWRPDVVVGGSQSYAAGLLAARLGVPHVRHTWDALEIPEANPYADVELAPELGELGLDALPHPDLVLDVTPPSISPAPHAPGTVHARWIGTNLARPIDPWMLARGSRPRICVTAGTRVAASESQEFLIGLARDLGDLDADLVVAAPEDVAPAVREALPELRVGWMPLEVLVPNCDLIVHHGGGSTAMNAMAAGTPQLVLSEWPLYKPLWQRLADHGSAIVLSGAEEHATERVAKACDQLLGDRTFAERASAMADEIAGLPGPVDHVRRIDGLVGR